MVRAQLRLLPSLRCSAATLLPSLCGQECLHGLCDKLHVLGSVSTELVLVVYVVAFGSLEGC